MGNRGLSIHTDLCASASLQTNSPTQVRVTSGPYPLASHLAISPTETQARLATSWPHTVVSFVIQTCLSRYRRLITQVNQQKLILSNTDNDTFASKDAFVFWLSCPVMWKGLCHNSPNDMAGWQLVTSCNLHICVKPTEKLPEIVNGMVVRVTSLCWESLRWGSVFKKVAASLDPQRGQEKTPTVCKSRSYRILAFE